MLAFRYSRYLLRSRFTLRLNIWSGPSIVLQLHHTGAKGVPNCTAASTGFLPGIRFAVRRSSRLSSISYREKKRIAFGKFSKIFVGQGKTCRKAGKDTNHPTKPNNGQIEQVHGGKLKQSSQNTYTRTILFYSGEDQYSIEVRIPGNCHATLCSITRRTSASRFKTMASSSGCPIVL